MGLYLSKYVGDGTWNNRFRPALEGSAIDLRPDCTKPDGYALVNSEDRARAPKLGEDFKDTFGPRVRNRVHNLLGVDVSRVKRFDVLAATLMLHPNGWKPLRPTPLRYEIWLGGLVWEFPLLRGGTTDNFTRADENPLAAPWTKSDGNTTFQLSSNTCALVTALQFATYFYTGAVSTNDHYSELSLVTTSFATGYRGPAVRCQSSLATFYCWVNADNGDSPTQGFGFKRVTGSDTDLIVSTSPAKANPMKLSAVGSTVSAYYNGVEVANSPATDSAVTTGQPGIHLNVASGADDWTGLDIGSPASGGPIAWITA